VEETAAILMFRLIMTAEHLQMARGKFQPTAIAVKIATGLKEIPPAKYSVRLI
jgi:hypothetical protein